MQNSRIAVIDFGTNTCKLLIAEPKEQSIEIIYRTQTAVKIGEQGLSKGIITEEAHQRLHTVLGQFQRTWEKYRPKQIWGVATSAFRNAKNANRIVNQFQKEFGISIEIISGEQEADLIYEGIKGAIKLKDETVLMMDIGGGSVEFIIANQRKPLWRQSYEIGGQRLMDRFMRTDPISDLDIQRMEIYLETQLFTLTEAIFRYAPKVLIGAAGSFETLAAVMYAGLEGRKKINEFIDEHYNMKPSSYEIDRDNFDELFRLIVGQNAYKRRLLSGMPEFRADMIVVATCLIRFVIEQYELPNIVVSSYGLKEGFLIQKAGEGFTI